MKYILVLCLLFVLLEESSSNREYFREVGQDRWKYVLGKNYKTFDATLSWCNSMGGQLPYIHTEEDMNFLHQVTDAYYYIDVWIGVKKTYGSCRRYLDGSIVDYNFKYWSTGWMCSWCTSDDCALVIQFNGNQRYAYFQVTSYNYIRPVCIIQVKNFFEKTPQNINTSMVSEMINERQNEFMKTISKRIEEQEKIWSKVSSREQIFLNSMTRNEKHTNNISSVFQTQMSQLNANFTALSLRFEDDRRTSQSHVIAFMVMFSVSVLLTVTFLIFKRKKQSVKLTPNIAMRYQAGLEAVSSLEPPVYESVSSSLMTKL